MSKTLNSLSVHLEGMHILDVYKPYRARKTTVITSSHNANRFCYQLPNLLMTTGTDLKKMLCLGRLTKQMVDFGNLTSRRLVKWTQLRLENLKGGARTARIGFASGVFKLASGAVNFGLWTEGKSRRVEIVTSKDLVAVLER